MKHKRIYPGVRYREHCSRRFNGVSDRYFFIRYRLHGKPKEEGLGWASEGWNAKKASGVLAKLKESHTTGDGPQTLGEKRQLAQEKKEIEEADKEREARELLTFGDLFINSYFPEAKNNKDPQSYPRLCRSLAHGGQKLVLGTSLPEFNPSKGPLLEAKFSHRGHDSPNLGEK